MFPYSRQQPSAVATANFRTLVNVTKRYASGSRTTRESTSIREAGSSVKPGEFLGWQSTPFAAIPEKAAAYTRHFLKIARATEADILNEARTQFEQYGFGMKGGFESAARQAQSAVQGPIALLSDLECGIDWSGQRNGQGYPRRERASRANLERHRRRGCQSRLESLI